MRWRKGGWQDGDKRIIWKFAFWPISVENSIERRWLEWVKLTIVYDHDSNGKPFWRKRCFMND